MDNAYLSSDEPIILASQKVTFKSAQYEVILTDRRLILVDSRKDQIRQHDLPVAAIRTVEAGENAIREPTLTLSLLADDGGMISLVLTFSQQQRERRKRECDDWAKKIKEMIVSFRAEPPRPGTAPPGMAATPRPATAKPEKIGIIRSDRAAVDLGPAPLKPRETSSLPTGVFCLRCGNRVPPGSEFCNRCGTKIIPPLDTGAGAESVTLPVPEPAPSPAAEPAPKPGPEPVTGQVSLPVPPAAILSPERKERPIDEVIKSIEPLIADSVPRTEEAPLITRETPAGPADTAGPAPAAEQAGTQETPLPAIPSAGETPAAPAAGRVPGAPPRRPNYGAIAAVVIIILAVAAGAVIYTQFLAGKTIVPAGPAETPATTTAATTVPTPARTPAPRLTETPQVTPQPSLPPQVVIPETGVWVRVQYPGTFSGSVGTPGNLQQISDTGDKFYQVPTSEGVVSVSVRKMDGSGDVLAIGVYKNGVLVKRSATTVPRGVIDLQVDLKPPTPAITPTQTMTQTMTQTTAPTPSPTPTSH